MRTSRLPFRPVFEALEDRRLLNAAPVVSPYLLGNFLIVDGTDQTDTIIVQHSGGRISVSGYQILLTSGQKVDSVAESSVGRIFLNGYKGNDTLRIDNSAVTGAVQYDAFLNGNEGNDKLFGGSEWDSLDGDENNDSIDGGGNDDLIDGGTGRNTIFGGDGNDSIHGGEAATIHGGIGNDQIIAGTQGCLMFGDGGDDGLSGWDGNDTVCGGAGNDEIFGGDANDYLMGGGGDDYLDGGYGDDSLHGGTGNDWLLGGENDDLLEGGAGNDTQYGEYGSDTHFGGPGDDGLWEADTSRNFLYGGSGRDRMSGIKGRDVLSASGRDRLVNGRLSLRGTLTINGSDWNDRIVVVRKGGQIQIFAQGCDEPSQSFPAAKVRRLQIIGGDGDDYIDLNSEGYGGDPLNLRATLRGGTGDDTLTGGSGSDFIDGGSGNDQFNRDSGGADTYKHAFDPAHPAVGDQATYDDVLQGALATSCSFLASLSADVWAGGLETNPLPRIQYVGQASPGRYKYRVQLFTEQGQTVYRDAYFDGTWTDLEPQPAAPGEFWVLLYYRAFQDLMREEGFNGEDTAHALPAITGRPSYSIERNFTPPSVPLPFTNADLLAIQAAISQGRSIVTGTPPDGYPRPAGLQAFHAYTVMSVELDSGEMLLRDPFGQEILIPTADFLNSMAYYTIS